MSFQIIPALDLRGGHVVRLQQGDYARETRFAGDPAALARRCADAGANWLHVVDLDGARAGRLENLEAIAAIRAAGALQIQAGGGVRCAADVERLLAAGVARVVVGSLAVSSPDEVLRWLADYGPERIVLALDTRRVNAVWRLPVRGWTVDSGCTLDDLVARCARAGARHILCTDISRDGMLGGINVELYRHLHALAPACLIQASGGARTLDDIRAARDAGAAAIILGRALLEGRIDLPAALAC